MQQFYRFTMFLTKLSMLFLYLRIGKLSSSKAVL